MGGTSWVIDIRMGGTSYLYKEYLYYGRYFLVIDISYTNYFELPLYLYSHDTNS